MGVVRVHFLQYWGICLMRLTIIVKAAVGERRGLDWGLKQLTPNCLLQHYQSHLCYSCTWPVSVQASVFTDVQIQKSQRHFLFTLVCYIQNKRLMTYQRPFALSVISGKIVSFFGMCQLQVFPSTRLIKYRLGYKKGMQIRMSDNRMKSSRDYGKKYEV